MVCHRERAAAVLVGGGRGNATLVKPNVVMGENEP